MEYYVEKNEFTLLCINMVRSLNYIVSDKTKMQIMYIVDYHLGKEQKQRGKHSYLYLSKCVYMYFFIFA